MNEPQAIGLCECGCGRKTRIAKYDDKRYGQVRGQPLRFLHGHMFRTGPRLNRYVAEDRGLRDAVLDLVGSAQE